MLIILPTWINLLLKAYAFIGIFGQSGAVNGFLNFMGLGSQQILFTDFSFIFVAAYIEIPFMVLPIFNAIDEIDGDLIKAGYDLGTTRLQNFSQIIQAIHFSTSLKVFVKEWFLCIASML